VACGSSCSWRHELRRQAVGNTQSKVCFPEYTTTSKSGNAFSFTPSPAAAEQAAGTGQDRPAAGHQAQGRQETQVLAASRVSSPPAAPAPAWSEGQTALCCWCPAHLSLCARWSAPLHSGGGGHRLVGKRGSIVLLVVAVWWYVSSGCTRLGKGMT
jgi:hypothetical protein